MNTTHAEDAVRGRLVQGLLAAIGLILLLLSVLFVHEGFQGYLREALKELGVVVLAVFTVSFIYERLLAERHQDRFISVLRKELSSSESNAGRCAALGITEILPSRAALDAAHPFERIVGTLDSRTSSLRVVGRSLFLTATKGATIRGALEKGASIELCLLDPGSSDGEVRLSPDLRRADIDSALARFRADLLDWVASVSPPGRLSIYWHRIPMLDSYVYANNGSKVLQVWEWSFGSDLEAKRALVVDPAKQLGRDLAARYDHVIKTAQLVFSYTDGKISRDQVRTENGPSNVA